MYQRHSYKDSSESDWTQLKDPAATLKRDGAHYYMAFNDKGVPSFISRRESVKGGFPDKTNRVPHLADVKLPQYSGHVYSVELVHTGKTKSEDGNHARVSGILNSLPAKAIESQKEHGPVRGVLLDVINPPLTTYQDKINHLTQLEKEFNKPDLIFNPKIYKGIPAVVKLIDSTKKEGKEGIIVTSLTKPENANFRIKVKHVDTYNLRISGMEEEHDIYGKPKGSMGALLLEDSTGKPVGKTGTGFTRDMRKDFWNNKDKAKGGLVQVKTFGQGGVDKSGKLKVLVYNGAADGACDKVG
jgi:hypothetical protein